MLLANTRACLSGGPTLRHSNGWGQLAFTHSEDNCLASHAQPSLLFGMRSRKMGRSLAEVSK